MTQEERDLLLKDLYARIPYGVKILHQGWNYEWDQELSTLEKVTGIDDNFIYTKVIDTHNGEEYRNDKWPIDIFNDKLYLFPLSSMTEEQFMELKVFADLIYEGNTLELVEWNDNCKTLEFWLEEVPSYRVIKVFDWLNTNHFDYRGLIPMGLAIDATNLNIY